MLFELGFFLLGKVIQQEEMNKFELGDDVSFLSPCGSGKKYKGPVNKQDEKKPEWVRFWFF